MHAEGSPSPIPAEMHTRRIQNMRDVILGLVEDIIARGIYHSGPYTQALQEAVATRWGVQAVPTSSGSVALEAAMRALGIGPGDEVIIPTLTFISTGFAPAATGATPVMVDIDPASRTISPEAVTAAVTPRTRAVIPVHMYGLMADMNALGRLAQRSRLAIVEDCAQAVGATCDGRYAGTLGEIGCISMWVGKNAGGLGDAGLLLTRDPALRRSLRMATDLGRDGDRHLHHVFGLRGRMGEVDAAVITHELGLLPEWIRRRRSIASRYNEAFTGLRVQTPTDAPGRPHTYFKYPLTVQSVEQAATLMQALAQERIEAEQIYPIPLTEQPAFASIPHRSTSTPNATRIIGRTVCLPVAPELTEEEVARVIDTVTRWAREH